MAVSDPTRVVGVHVITDMLAAAAVLSFAGVSVDPAEFDETERPLVERMNHFVREGLGHIAVQQSRPATIGYGLEDSPVAQLAWILEKFEEWTDLRHEGRSRTIDRDRLLATVTAYWLYHNGAASAHFRMTRATGSAIGALSRAHRAVGPSSVAEGRWCGD